MEGDNRWPVNITLFGHCNPGRAQYNSFDMTPKTATAADSAPAASPSASPTTPGPITMSIDIGGSGLKAMLLDPEGKPVSVRQRVLTPEVPTPAAVLAGLDELRKLMGRSEEHTSELQSLR